mgnify:CR=1 FL=1
MRIMLVLAKDNIYKYNSIHKRKYYPQITLITLESLIDRKYNADVVIVDEGVEKWDATSKKYENEKEMLKVVQSQLGIEDSNTIFRKKYEREGTSPYEYMEKITYDKEKNIYKGVERDRIYHKYDLIDTKKSEIDMKKLKIKISPLFPE